jgi:hypothetical protein
VTPLSVLRASLPALVLSGACWFPTDSSERCDGRDDDGDRRIDEDYGVGQPCDGPDLDGCEDGTWVCDESGDQAVCSDAEDDAPSAELCNSADDDCDGSIDEGFSVGESCDGDDDDLCADGATVCGEDGQQAVCDDGANDPVNGERCNDEDDDCDGTFDEGYPGLGDPCDGIDSDMCVDGYMDCTADGVDIECVDATDENQETCDGADDDCDVAIDEDFDLETDIDNCGGCGLACTNAHGTTDCVDGGCSFTCAPGAYNCNRDEYDGCESVPPVNPTCSAEIDLGTIAGDLNEPAVVISGTGEGWVRIFIDEQSTLSRYVTATAVLESGGASNFNLYMHCAICDSGVVRSSTETSGDDVIDYSHPDTSYTNDGKTLFFEVRKVSGGACAEWTLTITPNTDSVREDTCGG